MPEKIQRYGLGFGDSWDDLAIEFHFIRNGGTCIEAGRKFGNGLSFHYERARQLIWPHLDRHRWHDLCRDEILKNKVTVLMGPGSSGKTHEAAWIYLIEYWCHPEETCVLVSSTTIPGLRKRVWGEITMLWEKGLERYDWLSGNLLDSAIAITTDSLEDVEIGERKSRDMRKGVFGIPCVQGGKFVGLSKYQGIKQKRMRLIADEASAMDGSFLSAFANLNKNEDFRAIVLGNPADPLDPLGKAAEPRDGWTDEYLEPKKTTVWNTRFMGGRCVNLIGTDSPNFDFPPDKPTRYKYLISREKIQDTLSFFPKDSMEYYSQCVGTMKIGTIARRVLSREMCLKLEAQKKVVWDGSQPRTKVYFVDASYGGDRCVAGSAEFGIEMGGKQVLSFNEPKIIPILVVKEAGEPEQQIARFVKDDCEALDIDPKNMGHDSTGRGSLGTALAQVWSAWTNPIEFGGTPTDRPVSLDMRVLDEETGQMRLKTCKEHYDRFISEMWFSVRYAVEASQIRDLPEEPMEELCTRKWDLVKESKRSVEPKDRVSSDPNKQGMKQRTGKSPDMGDWAAGIVEMARRRGFQISKLANNSTAKPRTNYLDKFVADHEKMMRGKELQSV